jgi:hypothetical protein
MMCILAVGIDLSQDGHKQPFVNTGTRIRNIQISGHQSERNQGAIDKVLGAKSYGPGLSRSFAGVSGEDATGVKAWP